MAEFKYGDVLEPATPRDSQRPLIMFIANGPGSHNLIAIRLTPFTHNKPIRNTEPVGLVSRYWSRASWKLADD